MDGRTACCIAVGTLGFGVALLTLTFHQQGPPGIASQTVRLIPHTASALRVCVSWDVMPPVCPFPTPPKETQSGPLAEADALVNMGLPLVAPNSSFWQGIGPTTHQSLSDAPEHEREDSEVLSEPKQPERSASASLQRTAQQSRDRLAAACDKTHMFVIWGPLPVEASDQIHHDEASSSHAAPSVESAESSASFAAQLANVMLSREASWQPGLPPATDAQTDAPSASSSRHSGSHSNAVHQSSNTHVTQHGDNARCHISNAFGVSGAGAVDDPDHLVACLRRLRPHLHASDPFSPRAASGSTQSFSHSPVPQSSTPNRSLDDRTGQTTVQPASITQQRAADQPVQQQQQHQQQESSEDEEVAQNQAGLSAGSRGDKHIGAYPSWPCLKGPCTSVQLDALKICCSTVACFDVPHQPASLGSHAQGDDGDGKTAQQEHDQGSRAESLHLLGDDQGCGVQPLWRHPVVGASHLSAADGAVAIACSDGMLLLLDQATGQLIR